MADEHAPRWKMEIPLLMHGQTVGHLHLSGEPSGVSTRGDLEQVFVLLEPLEAKLQTLVDRDAAVPVSPGGAATLESSQVEAVELLSWRHPR